MQLTHSSDSVGSTGNILAVDNPLVIKAGQQQWVVPCDCQIVKMLLKQLDLHCLCLQKLKSTTITITHDVKVMERIADRVALLKEGEVFWVDNLKNTMESEDEYVKLFLNK